ncbi:MAG TPA: TrkA family potassium uptake protein [Anaerolineae bacterium]|jgi:trk system potassium uptake protein TrkA|nr:TrkA family potassium uptake protein [Anaerolineae bacterium]
MYIIIGGGGKVGASLARKLTKRGHAVVIIEKNPDKCARIVEDSEDVLVINGDACDVRYMEEAGAERADVLAAVTGDDDDNLVMCQLATEGFHIPKAVARVNNPRNERIFHTLGINALSSTTIITRLIEEEATIGDIVTLQALKKGNLVLVEMDLPSDISIGGKKLADIKIPREIVLVSIIRGEDVIIPRGTTTIQGGDAIIAVTSPNKEQALRDILAGKR